MAPLTSSWLFCDLDGTLVALPSPFPQERRTQQSTTRTATTTTPSASRVSYRRGGGTHCPVVVPPARCASLSDRYPSLAESPAFAPLVQWLRDGGNLVVISTADRRVETQVFVPLREFLAEIYAQQTAAAAADRRGSRLLLALWGGAALFECRPSCEPAGGGTGGSRLRMEPVTDYMVSALREFSPIYKDVAGDAAVPGTTLTVAETEPVRDVALELYQAAFCAFYCPSATQQSPHHDRHLLRLAPEYQQMWYRLRLEANAAASMTSTAASPSSKVSAAAAASNSADRCCPACVAFARSSEAILQQLHALRFEMCGGGVAQVLLLGLPMDFVRSTLMTPARSRRLHDLQVYWQAQPNSVIMARVGVHKGLVVRYVTDRVKREVASSRQEIGNRRGPRPDELVSFVALGDLPRSVDRKLIGNPDVPFVSVERLCPEAATQTASSSSQQMPFAVVGGEDLGAACFVAEWRMALQRAAVGVITCPPAALSALLRSACDAARMACLAAASSLTSTTTSSKL